MPMELFWGSEAILTRFRRLESLLRSAFQTLSTVRCYPESSVAQYPLEEVLRMWVVDYMNSIAHDSWSHCFVGGLGVVMAGNPAAPQQAAGSAEELGRRVKVNPRRNKISGAGGTASSECRIFRRLANQ